MREFKQFILNLISVRLCFSKCIPFKVGRFPLVAAYCPKCGVVKFGNSIYYDGTTYQKKYKGKDAVEFVLDFAEKLRGRDKCSSDFKKRFGYSLFDSNDEKEYRQNRESIKKYESIASVLKNA